MCGGGSTIGTTIAIYDVINVKPVEDFQPKEVWVGNTTVTTTMMQSDDLNSNNDPASEQTTLQASAQTNKTNNKNAMTRTRRATHDLYLALLAIVAIAVVQIFLHEATYLRDHMEHLRSPHNLDLLRFKKEILNEVEGVGMHVVDEMFDLARVEHHKSTHLRANHEGAPHIFTARHGTKHVHVPPEKHVLDILGRAGVDVKDIDEETLRKLPSLNEIESMYGSGVYVGGLDRCEEFRKTIVPADAFIAPAGMFNTGTNLMAQYLENNCYLPAKKEKYGKSGMRWQVPWGKHTPVSWRLNHVAETGGKGVNQTNVLPVVTIKDPYTWMSSMCRHSYSANWRHTDEHCPNLVANEIDRAKWHNIPEVIPVSVRYSTENVTHHESLLGLWNDYYSGWQRAKFPRLIVRFEDMLFRTEEVVTKVCQCAGGKMNEGPFKYIVDSAKTGKAHSGSSGLIKSIVRYGNSTRRVEFYDETDIEFIKKKWNKDLGETYSYKRH